MENDFWNNPGLKNMSPEKLQFLMNFASKEKPTNIKDMMPFTSWHHECSKNK